MEQIGLVFVWRMNGNQSASEGYFQAQLASVRYFLHIKAQMIKVALVVKVKH